MSLEAEAYTPKLMNVLSQSRMPISVLKYDQRWKLVAVSDGIMALADDQTSKENLMNEWNTNYAHQSMHPVDRHRLRESFENRHWHDGDTFDETVRIKLHGRNAYSLMHLFGYVVEKGTERYMVITHDDMSDALNKRQAKDGVYESAVYHKSGDDDTAFTIVDRDTHVIYYNNIRMEDVVRPMGSYHPGVTFEQYLYGLDTKITVDLNRYVQNTDVLTENQMTKERFLLNVTPSVWNQRSVYLIKAKKLDFRYFDTLTKIPNMNYFRLKSTEMVQYIQSLNIVPTIIFLDVKNMQLYNHTYGFEAGDQLLRDTGELIRNTFDSQYVFRFSDDHFVVLTGDQDIYTKLRRIATDIRRVAIGAAVEIRAGIFYLHDLSDSEVIAGCDKAKLACDSIRNSVKDFVKVYDESLSRRSEIYDYVSTHIDEAIKNEWIHVYYQPVVRTLTDSLCSFEALSRWIDPVYGFLNPGAFIGALEETHQIHKLDTYMINRVCQQLRHRLDHHQVVVPVSFNLSRLDFTSCDIFKVVEDARQANDISRDLIHIEITESIIAENEEIRNWASRFRKAGYEVWMDDFGSGYSSLNVLKDYDFDELKVDMLFLSRFTAKSKVILTSVVEMAKKLHIQTLAEGVETKEEYDFLKSIGCEKVQGYYFGKPMPLDQAIEHLHTNHVAVEDYDYHRYYRLASSTNLISDDPLAMIEAHGDYLHYLFMNGEYRQLTSRLGLANAEETEAFLNRRDGNIYATYRELMAKAHDANDVVSAFAIENEEMLIINMRQVIKQDDRAILEVKISSTDVSSVGNNLAEMNSFIVQMVMIYNNVNIFNYDSDIVDAFVQNGKLFSSDERQKKNIKRYRYSFCTRLIHPDDQDRYLDFTDPRTMEKRLRENKHHYISDRFRVFNAQSMTYEWRLFTEMSVLNKAKKHVVMELIKLSIIEENHDKI